MRPLLAWFFLVLILFGIRAHQQMIEQTRLVFSVSLEGQPAGFEVSTLLDGEPIVSGQRVSLGNHRLSITHPKGEPISSNLFLWYGERNLGTIPLERTRGTLRLEVEPPAMRLSIRGGDFSLGLTNSGGVTSSVPTDVYRFEAQWANYDLAGQVTVAKGTGGSTRIAPPLGDLIVESEPSGAIVVERSRARGTTPLHLRNLRAGPWNGEVRLDGHVPVSLTVVVAAGQTNFVRTNLVNWQYTQAMEAARTHLGQRDNDQALEALESAFRIKPNDPEVERLKREATVFQYVRKAEALANNRENVAARSEAEKALRILPDNAAVQSFLARLTLREEETKHQEDEKKRREAEEAEQRRQERLAVPKKAFAAAVKSYSFSDEGSLFDALELKTSKSAAEAQTLIESALRTGFPGSVVKSKALQWPETFAIFARQEVSGGLRHCVVVCVQAEKEEAQILVKVMEYKNKNSITLEGGLTFNKSFVPLHPSRIGPLTDKMKAQIEEGKRIVEEGIREALGESLSK